MQPLMPLVKYSMVVVERDCGYRSGRFRDNGENDFFLIGTKFDGCKAWGFVAHFMQLRKDVG